MALLGNVSLRGVAALCWGIGEKGRLLSLPAVCAVLVLSQPVKRGAVSFTQRQEWLLPLVKALRLF